MFDFTCAFLSALQHVPQFSAVQLSAKLQKLIRRYVDVDVVRLPLARRPGCVVAGERQMDLPDRKGVVQALHETPAGVFSYDLIRALLSPPYYPDLA